MPFFRRTETLFCRPLPQGAESGRKRSLYSAGAEDLSLLPPLPPASRRQHGRR